MISREVSLETIMRAHTALRNELGYNYVIDNYTTKGEWYTTYRCRVDPNLYTHFIFETEADYTYFMLRFA